ncbi:MAG: DNA polymerase-4 [Motiliproteus sp.]
MKNSNEKNQRKIIHADCDCFFAAVEMRDNPQLQQVPMAIGGEPGRRGVIATCNYLAREYGIRSAMASATAKRLCPGLLILPGNMEKYRRASEQVNAIFCQYTDLVEPLSLDEAFLDVSHSTHYAGSATRIAQQIRRQVQEQVGISISAGVAPNKFIAKIASDWNKPDGLCVVAPAQVDAFVAALPVARIYGVGPAMTAKLQQRGIDTCQDLRRFERSELLLWLGSFGERLYWLCRGVDDRSVRIDRRRKSLSVEQTYLHDLRDLDACIDALPVLILRLQRRLEAIQADYSITGTSVKVKFDDFTQTTVEAHSSGFGSKTLVKALLEEGFKRRLRPVRLLGLGVKLGEPELMLGGQQLSLFS